MAPWLLPLGGRLCHLQCHRGVAERVSVDTKPIGSPTEYHEPETFVESFRPRVVREHAEVNPVDARMTPRPSDR